MPLSILRIRPGVNTQATPTLLEAGWSQSNLIRFRDGMIQKVGGWVQAIATALPGVCRGLHSWTQINGLLDMGIGTHLKLLLFQLGSLFDLTPVRLAGAATNPFSTTIGSASVNVAIPNHGAAVGDFFELGGVQYTIGGLTLSGEFQVATVPNANNLTITAGSAATATATSGGITAAAPLATAAATAVASAGAGYAAGETIVLAGGTFATPAVLTVTAVGAGGSVSSAALAATGVYTSTPSNPAAQSATSGAGVGATFTVTFASTAAAALSATPQAGGSGYAVNDTITLAGGSGTLAVVLKVTAVSGGAITAVAVQTAGSYTVTPTNPVAQGTTSGSGSGATFNVAWTVTAVWDFLLPIGSQDTGFAQGYGAGPYGAGLYGEATASGYQLPCRLWFIDNWGEFMLACPQNGAIYQWQPSNGTGTRATPLLNAPLFSAGILVGSAQQQAIAFGAETGGTQDPMLVRWTDVGSNTSWVAAATNQAGSFRLSRGSKIVGALGSALTILLWTNEGLWLMQYIGPPLVYSFIQAGFSCGLMAAKAAAATPSGIFWMDQNANFFRFAGTVAPVECLVRDRLFGNINPVQANKIFAAVNSQFNEVWWFYPSLASTEIDSYVKYNYVESVWDYGTLTRTAWEDHENYPFPMATDTQFLYNHETGVDANGAPMPCFAETGYFMASDGGELSFWERIIPDFNSFAGPITITVLAVDHPNSDVPTSYGPFTITPGVTPYVSIRARNRAIAVAIASNALGGNFRLGAMRARVAGAGKR